MSWPWGVARITAAVGRESRGTGTLVAPGVILTALHVVADGVGRPPVPDLEVSIEFSAGHRLPAKTLSGKFDIDDDWVLLNCPTVPGNVMPRNAGPKSATGPWRSFGFPRSNPEDGFHLQGSILGEVTYAGVGKVLQLQSAQLDTMWVNQAVGLGNQRILQGMSGAPLLVNECIVGFLRAHLPTAATVYAGTLEGIPLLRNENEHNLELFDQRFRELVRQAIETSVSPRELHEKYEDLFSKISRWMDTLPPGETWNRASSLKAHVGQKRALLASRRASKWGGLLATSASVATAVAAFVYSGHGPIIGTGPVDAGVDAPDPERSDSGGRDAPVAVDALHDTPDDAPDDTGADAPSACRLLLEPAGPGLGFSVEGCRPATRCRLENPRSDEVLIGNNARQAEEMARERGIRCVSTSR